MRETNLFANDTSNRSVGRKVVAQAQEALLSAFSRPDPAYFALVTLAVDCHRMRVFDTETGTLKCDYRSENGEKLTSLGWGAVTTSNNPASDKANALASKGRKRKAAKGAAHGQDKLLVIVLGTDRGRIVFYNVNSGQPLYYLSSGHTSAVRDIALTHDGCTAYSCSDDGKLVEWELTKSGGQMKRDWKATVSNPRSIELSHDQRYLLVAGYKLEMWDLRKQSVTKSFTGHASMVKSALFTSDGHKSATCAENDRTINVWDCRADSADIGAATVLSFDDDIVQMDLAFDHSLMAVSADGRIALWRDISQSALSALTSSKKKRMATRLPATVVRFTSTADENVTIPTIAACYAHNDDASRILVARGSSLKPEFEVVGIPWSDELDTPKEMNLKRVYEQGALLKNGISADAKKNAASAYQENNAMIVTGNEVPVMVNGNAGVDQVDSDEEGDKESRGMTIEQQLRQLAVNDSKNKDNKSTQAAGDKAVVVPKANSLQQVLVQALQSNDQNLLTGCLAHSNQQLVHNTVRRLPARLVVPFLDTLIERFRASPLQSRHYSTWIKAVLLYHTSYLATLPSVVQQLSLLYQTIDARVNNHSRLLRLSGRLDLLLSQVDVRPNELQPEDDGAPESVYIEGEEDDMSGQSGAEDDEDMLELIEGADSDDDDLDSDEDDEDDEDEDEEDEDDEDEDEEDEEDSDDPMSS